MPAKTRKTKSKSQDFMFQLEKYRQTVASKMAAVWRWLQEIVLFVVAPSNRITWRDMWNQLLLTLCVVKSRIADSKEKKRLLEWVSTKIKHGKPPTDFNESWRNGIALCALVEGIVKGSCPRYDLLNPENAQANIKLALRLIQKHIRIKPGMTIEDFMNFDASAERKLVGLVSQLKLASAKLRLKLAVQRPAIILNPVTTIAAEGECIAKGMGLMLAVKGRKARFHIYLKSLTLMNIVIEIRGPENTICSERITNRSPKKRTPAELMEEEGWRKIPLDYNIQPKKITVGYTPLVIGSHKLSIIWQGQHIIGSPYTISVDDAARTIAATPKEIRRLIVPLKKVDSLEEFANKDNSKRRKYNSISLGSLRKLGNVTKKRVLRRILTIDGKEVVIEDSEVESLAKAIKELRTKSIFNNNGCNLLELNNTRECEKFDEKSLAHQNKKSKNAISSFSSIEKAVAATEKPGSAVSSSDRSSDKSSVQARYEFSNNVCHTVDDVKSSENTTAENSLQSNCCMMPSRTLSLKQKEAKAMSGSPCTLSVPNETWCNLSALSYKSKGESLTTKSFSINNSSNNLSSDFSQQINNSTNILPHKESVLQQNEYHNTNYVKRTDFRIPCYNYALYDSSPSDNGFNKNLFFLNEKASQVSNNNESKKACNAAIHGDSPFRGHSQEMLQTLACGNGNYSQEINCAGIKAHENCETSLNIPERTLTEKCDQNWSSTSDIFSRERFPSNIDNKTECNKQKQISPGKNLKDSQEIRKAELERKESDVDFLEFSAEGYTIYDHQNYPIGETLLEDKCISKEVLTAVSCDNSFQNSNTINLSDSDVTTEAFVKENVISDSGNILSLENGSTEDSKKQHSVDKKEGVNQKEENSIVKSHKISNLSKINQYDSSKMEILDTNQDSYSREGFDSGNILSLENGSTEDSKKQHSVDKKEGMNQKNEENSIVKSHKISNLGEINQHDSSKMEILDTNQDSYSREGFLLEVADENFNESLCAREDIFPKTCEIRDTSLNEDIVMSQFGISHCESHILEESPGNKTISNSEESLGGDRNISITEEFSSDANTIMGKIISSKSTKPSISVKNRHSTDNKSFSSNSTDIWFPNGDIGSRKASDRGKKYLISGKDVDRTGTSFDKCTGCIEEPNPVNPASTTENTTNKYLEEAISICDTSTQKTTECQSRSADNYGKMENQNATLTSFHHSEEFAEIPTTPTKQLTSNELNEPNRIVETVLSLAIDSQSPCSNPLENTRLLEDSSDSSVFLSHSIQQKDKNAKQQRNDITESKNSTYDSDEEKFPFAAMVQAKKEFWEKKLGRRSSKQECRTGISFPKCSRNVEELNRNLCMQNVVRCHGPARTTDKTTSKYVEEPRYTCDTRTWKTTEESQCRSSDNYGKMKIQNVTVTNFQHSEESVECPTTPATQLTGNELKETRRPIESILSPAIDSNSLQNTKLLESSSVSLVFLSHSIQQKDNNAKKQSNDIQEGRKSTYDSEEEEFPLAAIVQTKKEFWEKKLGEK